jgi:hypothetical protein
MPLSWKIAPLERMVVCTAEGTVGLPDMLAYFRALDEARGLPVSEDLHRHGRRVGTVPGRSARDYQGTPLAGTSRNKALADIFRMLSQVDRPLFICATIHDARQWLARRRASMPGR